MLNSHASVIRPHIRFFLSSNGKCDYNLNYGLDIYGIVPGYDKNFAYPPDHVREEINVYNNVTFLTLSITMWALRYSVDEAPR